MEYGKLLSRAWDIVWKFKFLAILGVFVALGSSLGSGASGGTGTRWQTGPQGLQFDGAGVPWWMVVVIAALGLIVVLTLWVLSTLARGALVAGAGAADRGEPTGFAPAWRAAWNRVLTLLGIGLVPALVGLVPLLLAAVGLLAFVGNVSVDMEMVPGRNMAIIAGALACLIVPLLLVLELLRALAERACMLEGLGVVAAYRRAFRVAVDNLGSAVVLFLIQVAVIIAAFIVLVVPGVILLLCCLFWPVFLLLEGAATAYFSTMWTLAWRQWTDVAAATEIGPSGDLVS